MTRRLPWLGLFLAALGWAFSHQVGSDAVFDDCRRGSAGFILSCMNAYAVFLKFAKLRQMDRTPTS
jgi:hypothetical protein